MCYAGLHLKARSKLGLGAKPATPPTPHPQLRKINCTFATARAEKAAWWAAMWHVGLAAKVTFAPKVLTLSSFF